MIDDCALARLIKRRGAIWIGLTAETRSLRRYETLGEIWNMVARSAYAQLGYSPLLLAAAVTGMVIVFIFPLAALVISAAALILDPSSAGSGMFGVFVLAVVTNLMLSGAYMPTRSLYGRDHLYGDLLWIAAAYYCAMTVDSARRHRRGEGGCWKGRTYGPASAEQER